MYDTETEYRNSDCNITLACLLQTFLTDTSAMSFSKSTPSSSNKVISWMVVPRWQMSAFLSWSQWRFLDPSNSKEAHFSEIVKTVVLWTGWTEGLPRRDWGRKRFKMAAHPFVCSAGGWMERLRASGNEINQVGSYPWKKIPRSGWEKPS